ncbi:MAG TPA: hypothetical protein VD788_15825, partial [Candidatus Polarisedimenticolaceae bacterium]|nr:hypothetical protein [Candidatus Polarisedimenticolaceae bacterium]
MALGKNTARSILMVVGLFAAVWAIYRFFDDLTQSGSELYQSLLPMLSLALVVLALALAGVLIRNLVRLVVEHKRGILGARLRSKLVFYYFALVLLPALVLFYGSAHVIKQSVEAVLKTPLEDLTRRSGAIVQEWRDYLQSQALDIARSIASEIEERGYGQADDVESGELLRRWRLDDDLRHIRVTREGRVLAEAHADTLEVDAGRREELKRLVDSLELDVSESGREQAHIDYLGDGLLAHAA